MRSLLSKTRSVNSKIAYRLGKIYIKISLTPEQENLINTKLQTGKYGNVGEALEIALKLLDEYERSDAEWTKDVKAKIDAAISASKNTPSIDGENSIKQTLKSIADYLDPWTQSLIGVIQIDNENSQDSYVDYLEEKYS